MQSSAWLCKGKGQGELGVMSGAAAAAAVVVVGGGGGGGGGGSSSSSGEGRKPLEVA